MLAVVFGPDKFLITHLMIIRLELLSKVYHHSDMIALANCKLQCNFRTTQKVCCYQRNQSFAYLTLPQQQHCCHLCSAESDCFVLRKSRSSFKQAKKHTAVIHYRVLKFSLHTWKGEKSIRCANFVSQGKQIYSSRMLIYNCHLI